MRGTRTEIIETEDQICDLVDSIASYHAPPLDHLPILYVDVEGVNLCRDGSVSILTLLIDLGGSAQRLCLIDVHKLGARAFRTAGAKQKTLKDILQDERILKIFFDVRNDSDALYAHFGVALQGVEDVQLMESAARKTTASRRFLNGLTKCIESKFSGVNLSSWKLVKQRGKRLFKAEHGGSYNVFNQRPLLEDIVLYCVGDVHYLPELRKQYRPQSFKARDLVNEETKKRVAASQKPDYQPHGQGRAMAPWNQQQNKTLDDLNPQPYHYDIDDSFHLESDNGNDYWDDDGPTSCRDIISDWDYEYYYSD